MYLFSTYLSRVVVVWRYVVAAGPEHGRTVRWSSPDRSEKRRTVRVWMADRPWCAEWVLARDENGRKRSVNTKIITVFIFFIRNKIENGNSGTGNDIGISETSETKVRCGKYTGNGRNLNTIGKHIKLHNKAKLTKHHKYHKFTIHDITSSQYNKFTI
jgi:hypothetical protein